MAADMTGKVVAVTGAAGNVGQGVLNAIAPTGARIALIDRDAAKISRRLSALGRETDRYKGLPADLTDPDAVDTLVSQIHDHYGRIDALVHTVGGFAMGDPVHAGNMDVFDQMMLLNARLGYLVCGKFAAYMVERGIEGTIVAVLARSGQKGIKNQAAYTASKAAATRIVESMALELRDYNIRVNGISPSTVDTEPNRDSMPNADFEKWVTPDQIGQLAAFLVSDEARAINGENIVIANKV